MTELEAVTLLRDTIWVGIYVSTPILAVALLSGLVVGLFQALTSIQELTLTFVPKLLAIAAAFWVTMSFIASGLIALFQERIIPLIEAG